MRKTPPAAGGGPVEAHFLAPHGAMPNNARLPLLIYRAALPLGGRDPAADCEALFERHGWRGAWRNGIYGYDHFHATKHEVLGVVRGRARVRFGGPGGVEAAMRAGDVVVIPAGVGHKNQGASDDLLVVGAYPGGGEPDIRTPEVQKGAGHGAVDQAARVPAPEADPVYGRDGPLIERWRSAD
jgi:uncharacterized protein YjlB